MYGAAGAGAAAAAAAAAANAIKASGAIIRVTPDEFLKILGMASEALVVHSTTGVFTTKYAYLTSHKGFVFYTKSASVLQMPGNVEVIHAKKIWIPD